MNPSIESTQFQQDRALLDDFQRELVIAMRQRLKAGDLDNNDLCKFADKCAVFQKLANDREKTAIGRDRQVDGRERVVVSRERVVVSHQRVSAMYHIARARNDTQLEIARIRAEAVSARRRPDHPQVDDDDPLAPWGRKKDGTPYTHEEFRASLNEAIRDIWGLKPINPNSYMPWEMRPDPDSTPPLPDRERDGMRAGSSGAPDGEDTAAARTASAAHDPFVISNSEIATTTGSSSNPKETSPARYPSGDG
jgi:hypothetical protein